LKSIRDELEHQRHYSELLKSQYVLYSETLHLVQNQFVRDSQSYISGALQIWEYEKSKLLYIDKKQKILSLQLELLTLLKTIDHIELSGIEANLNFDKEQNRLQQKLHKSQDDLLIALERWKETYLLIATSAGTLNYMRDWSRENLIKNLECIFTITPIDPGGYKAKIVIPAIGIEKVKLGQQVNIKLEGYPSTEYGLLQGIVGTISNIPTEKGYPAIVNLPSEVITSCGFKINSERELSGTAEIVIENKSVFDRLINPFKSLLKNKMDK